MEPTGPLDTHPLYRHKIRALNKNKQNFLDRLEQKYFQYSWTPATNTQLHTNGQFDPRKANAIAHEVAKENILRQYYYFDRKPCIKRIIKLLNTILARLPLYTPNTTHLNPDRQLVSFVRNFLLASKNSLSPTHVLRDQNLYQMYQNLEPDNNGFVGQDFFTDLLYIYFNIATIHELDQYIKMRPLTNSTFINECYDRHYPTNNNYTPTRKRQKKNK